MTEQTFKSCMTLLQGIYGIIDKPVYLFYWNKFKSVDDKTFEAATNKIVDTFKPTSTEKFPVPARFIELTEPSEETRINLAIGAVRKAGSTQGPYKSVSFGDRALHAAIMRFGGWPAVSVWSDEDWKFREKSFIQTYRAEMTTLSGPTHLMGLSEEDFDNKQFDIPTEKLIAYQNSIKTHEIKWTGYKLLLESKAEKEPLKISQEVNDIISTIGKEVPNVREEN